jgi:hypothetical protein
MLVSIAINIQVVGQKSDPMVWAARITLKHITTRGRVNPGLRRPPEERQRVPVGSPSHLERGTAYALPQARTASGKCCRGQDWCRQPTDEQYVRLG